MQPVRLAVVTALASAAVLARAQTAPATEPAAPPVPALPVPARGAELAPVTITGSRPDEVQERRQSTAAKIIVGRDEIERFGDTSLGDVLKRLPGVTIQGRPGRGGAIRFRGLGNGYTQILLDGERVPPGFSLDAIPPEQIERIEILRAPTAETGARAIAGTINIVTRGGYTRRVNDLRLSLGHENGRLQPGASWTRNQAFGPFIVNTSVSAYRFDHDSSGTTTTEDRRLSDDALTLAQTERSSVRVQGAGLHFTGRLQWRPEGGTDSATLTPILFFNHSRSRSASVFVQSVGDAPAPYDTARATGIATSVLGRLNGEWTHRLGGADRLEWHGGYSRHRAPSETLREETTGGVLTRSLDDITDSHDSSFTTSVKWVQTVQSDHSLVSGAELEANRRDDVRTTLQRPDPLPLDLGANFGASALRLAAYAQDEWSLSPHWSAQAGLRWEGIRTRGDIGAGQPQASNASSVWSPLLHAVWKPEPGGRDQVRASLTRSYRSPTLANLVGRTSYNTRYPVDGPNTPTQADRAGNPNLRPELATGIDIAIERYLAGSGLLSANIFRRAITDYMRSQTRLETVPYASVPRYVLRPQNVGSAVTQGLELEAKFRASDLWAGAPRIDVRANTSVFASRVKSVPGPDNRLDQQPDLTANLGADYRFASWPISAGASLNWTPGYRTRVSETQTASLGPKLVADAFVLWVVDPGLQLRFSLSNLDPRDYRFGAGVDGPDIQGRAVRETSATTQPTFVNAQLRLEWKL